MKTFKAFITETFDTLMDGKGAKGHHIGEHGITKWRPFSHFVMQDHKENPGKASETMRGRLAHRHRETSGDVNSNNSHYVVKFKGLHKKNMRKVIDDGGESNHLDIAKQLLDAKHINKKTYKEAADQNDPAHTAHLLRKNHGIHALHYTNNYEGSGSKCVIALHHSNVETVKSTKVKPHHILKRIFNRITGKKDTRKPTIRVSAEKIRKSLDTKRREQVSKIRQLKSGKNKGKWTYPGKKSKDPHHTNFRDAYKAWSSKNSK